MRKKKDRENSIHEIFNKNTFVKVKPAFDISKIIFSFVQFHENNGEWRREKSIECYLTIADAGLLAKKITSGRMYTSIEKERNTGKEYPDAVWKSPLGGVDEKRAAEQNLRSDGKAVSRRFTLAPGASKYGVLTATQCAGYTSKEGLIIPETNDENKVTIRVAVENWDEVEKLGIMLEAAVYAYMIHQTSKRVTANIPDNTPAQQIDNIGELSAKQEDNIPGPPIVWPEDVLG